MREVSREWLEFLREQYPKGSRVRLTKMGNDPHPVPPGSIGTLKYIDDIGQFHVKWDNGRGLALIIGEDQFQILPPEPQTIKFYMPLTAQLYAYDDWGDLEEYGNDLDGRELRDYQSCIHEALLENQMPEEKSRGLMHWYDKPDGVNTKVQSVMLDVESRDGQLWGVAECKVNGTLLPEEKEALAEYISGQASDGWGEGFEQRAIKLNDGELYEDDPHHNCVFVGLDENGEARHAHLRSTGSQGKVFRINVEGSDIKHSFHKNGTDRSLYVFEAPIDLLSHITLYPAGWLEHSYVACCGTSIQPVLERLRQNPKLDTVYLCLDNDEAGEDACDGMLDTLEDMGYDVERLRPEGKDWNDDLRAKRGGHG